MGGAVAGYLQCKARSVLMLRRHVYVRAVSLQVTTCRGHMGKAAMRPGETLFETGLKSLTLM